MPVAERSNPRVAPMSLSSADLARSEPRLQVVDGASFSSLLSAYREDRGLTVRQAGRLVGGSHWVWAQWEAGVTPGPLYLQRLASLLDLSPQRARQLAGPDRVRRPASVGENYSHPLAQARLQADLSAADFARHLHVSASLVSRWESGERLPGRGYWPRIAEVLGKDDAFVEALHAQRRAPSDTVSVRGLNGQRRRIGFTQAKLAAAVGVDVTTIQRWEQRGRAPHRQARVVADVLRVDMDVLARPSIAPARAKPVESQLRALRRRSRLSSGVVARRVGVSISALLAWERGSVRPTWAQARRLAQSLSVSSEAVFAAAALDPPRHLDTRAWSRDALPDILSELRRWQGWTQEEMASVIGVSPSTVRAWERGRQTPRRALLARIDERLGTPVRLSTLV